MNSSWLPSRRIVGLVIVPMVTVFSLWLIGTIRAEQAERATLQALNFERTLGTAIDGYNTKDSDSDLLKDWEEFLYETDIYNPDTDGDGLDDYTEVIDPIRDPLVPDAELGRYVAPDEDGEEAIYYTEDDSLNATEKFSRDAFNAFAQLQQSDSLGTNVQDVLLEKVSETVDERERKQGIYTMDDVTVAAGNSASIKENYRQAFTRSVTPLARVKENDLTLLALYSESNNPGHIETMMFNAEQYEQFLSSITDVVVPPEIASVHLELINHSYVLKENIKTMATADQDPLGAMIAAGDYTATETALETVIQALSLYFNGN